MTWYAHNEGHTDPVPIRFGTQTRLLLLIQVAVLVEDDGGRRDRGRLGA